MFRINKYKLGVIRSLLFIGLLAFGLAATTGTPALASGGTFQKTGSMHVARDGHTATLLANGEVLVAGGDNSSFGGSSLASAELYNPATGTWTLTGSMTVPGESHQAVRLQNGQVLVAGGGQATKQSSGFVILASAELYTP